MAATDRWILALDGYSGAGKTSLAEQLAAHLQAGVIHADDLQHGWDDLAGSVERMAGVAAELSQGRRPAWPVWDWARGEPGETVAYQGPLERVIIEGCGAGAAPVRRETDLLVWLEVPPAERRSRLAARADWPVYEPWFPVWSEQEAKLRATDDPRPAAHLILSPGVTPTRWCPAAWK